MPHLSDGRPHPPGAAWQRVPAVRCSRSIRIQRLGSVAMVERSLRLRHVGLSVAIALASAGASYAQQQQDLGPLPVAVASTPYTFDTAEQHGIKVSVVVRGLNHPFSLAFL